MDPISFNEESTRARSALVAKKPLLVRMVLATKIVSTDRQAEYVLVGIAILAIVMAVWMWPKGRPAPSENIPVAVPSTIVR